MRFKDSPKKAVAIRIVILVTSHIILFLIGWNSAHIADTPSVLDPTRQGGFLIQAERAPAIHETSSKSHTNEKSILPQDDLKESSYRRQIFQDSKIPLLTINDKLSEASIWLLDLNQEELSYSNKILSDLLQGIRNAQSKSVKVLLDEQDKQVYQIDDFSTLIETDVSSAVASLTERLGEDRAKFLINGIRANQSALFADFGVGLNKVTFSDSGKSLAVKEEKFRPDGGMYSIRNYNAENIPARYKNLFIIK